LIVTQHELTVRSERGGCTGATFCMPIVGQMICPVLSKVHAVTQAGQSNNLNLVTVQAARRIGIVGLFTRSLPLRVMLVGPLVTAQWFCYDTCKVLSGL